MEGAAALDISITPDHIESGDTVTINAAGLANGSTFALRMEATVGLEGQDEFSFEATNVNIPFSLNSPVVRIRAEPATRAGLRVQTGGTAKSIEAFDNDDGVVNPDPQGLENIKGGSVDLLRAYGDAVSGSESVDFSLELSGTKMGPDNSQITFDLAGIDQGTARIVILVNGNEEVNKNIIIGEVPTATPTQTPTASPTATTLPGSSGSTGAPSGSIPTTTPEPSNSISAGSLDGVAGIIVARDAITGVNPESLAIIESSPMSVPADWQVIAGTYVVSPAAARFSPAATLSLRLNGEAATPFLAAYASGTWTIVPSRIEGNAIVADITAPGQFALMTFASEATVTPDVESPTVIPASGETTPVTGTPTQKAGPDAWFLGMLSLAAIAGGALLVARKRQ
ncbi:hypothetical protein ABH15_07910 [Methanoculleus taiwanensis]|uniref:Uncharacterized protein n=1 Tax=Methanoculleus taiwanensis TaxID=1550565 RepID=A0A498H2C3_9EURY|nr:hypothetical protein ABH15_07910 [Methanoculleus taiwanensis]